MDGGFTLLWIALVVFVLNVLVPHYESQRRRESWLDVLSPGGFERVSPKDAWGHYDFDVLLRRGDPVEVFVRKGPTTTSLVVMAREWTDRRRWPTYHEVVSERVKKRALPKFRLRPEGFPDSIASALGWNDIDLDADPHFSILHHLTGESSSAVRGLFGPETTRAFRERRGWFVSGAGEWLTLTKRRHQGSRRLAAFVQEALALAEAFRTAPKPAPGKATPKP